MKKQLMHSNLLHKNKDLLMQFDIMNNKTIYRISTKPKEN